MKQCKVCGTLVKIESGTCPSCGNHSFFALDVKICPICGKVNSITSSFCEQCGKQFAAVSGSAYVKPVKRQPAYRNEDENGFEIQKNSARTSESYAQEESFADRVYKDFIALNPEVDEKDGHTEFSYYIKGDKNKLPVVILPKFAKTSGKNIIVNIVVKDEDEQIKPSLQKTQETPPVSEPFTAMPVQAASGEFKPFSAIEAPAPVKATEEIKVSETVQEIPALPENNVKPEKDKGSKKIKQKLLKDLNIKEKKPAKKAALTFGSVFSSLSLIILSAAALYFFTLVFYNTNTSGLSPVLFFLKTNLKIDVPISVAYNGYVDFWAANQRGPLFPYEYFMPAIFTVSAIFLALSAIINIFTMRHRIWAKTVLLIMSVITFICLTAIIVAAFVVYDSGFNSLGVGLYLSAAISLINLFIMLFGYKAHKVK